MKAMLRSISGFFVTFTMTLLFVPVLGTANGQEQFIPQAHCEKLGVECANCQGGTLVKCTTPEPTGFSIGSCHQGGTGCTRFATWDCGDQLRCSNSTPLGIACSYDAVTVCK